MDLIYQFGIWFYKTVAWLSSPFYDKARLWHNGHKAVFPYLKEKLKTDKPIIWIHAASLGEFEQGRPLIEKIKKSKPNYRILLTFFSPSGYEVRKNYEEADYICYLPSDTKRNAKRFLELVNPEKVFFVKYEFWNNYFSQINKLEIPLYLVSGIFRKDQLFFKQSSRGLWYRNILNKVNFFFVQNQESADLLKSIGFTNSITTGDTRFDRVAAIASAGKGLPVIEQFKGNRKLIIAGSSWEPDEKLLVTYAKNNPSVKFIFAPHEVKESNIKRLETLLGDNNTVRYSKAENSKLNTQFLIIDSIGLLSNIYRYADIAYIGGGFGAGIHNTLEAAIYNIPVLFGPNYHKFQEAIDLIKNKIAFSVSNQEELNNILNKLLSDRKECEKISKSCHSFMKQNLGATQRIFEKVFNN